MELAMWEPISLDEFFSFLQEKEYLISEAFKKSEENEPTTAVATVVTKKEIKRNESKMRKLVKDFDHFETEKIDFNFYNADGKTKSERVIISRSLFGYDDNPQELKNKKKLNSHDFRDACLAYQEARRDKAISC